MASNSGRRSILKPRNSICPGDEIETQDNNTDTAPTLPTAEAFAFRKSKRVSFSSKQQIQEIPARVETAPLHNGCLDMTLYPTTDCEMEMTFCCGVENDENEDNPFTQASHNNTIYSENYEGQDMSLTMHETEHTTQILKSRNSICAGHETETHDNNTDPTVPTVAAFTSNKSKRVSFSSKQQIQEITSRVETIHMQNESLDVTIYPTTDCDMEMTFCSGAENDENELNPSHTTIYPENEGQDMSLTMHDTEHTAQILKPRNSICAENEIETQDNMSEQQIQEIPAREETVHLQNGSLEMTVYPTTFCDKRMTFCCSAENDESKDNPCSPSSQNTIYSENEGQDMSLTMHDIEHAAQVKQHTIFMEPSSMEFTLCNVDNLKPEKKKPAWRELPKTEIHFRRDNRKILRNQALATYGKFGSTKTPKRKDTYPPKQSKSVRTVEVQVSTSLDESCPKTFDVPQRGALISDESTEVNGNSRSKQTKTVGTVEEQVSTSHDDSCPKIPLIPDESTEVEVKSSSQSKQNKTVGTVEQEVSPSIDNSRPNVHGGTLVLISDELTEIKISSQPKQNLAVESAEEHKSTSLKDSCPKIALIPDDSTEVKGSSQLKQNSTLRNVEEQVSPSIDDPCSKIFDVPNGRALFPDESTEVKSSSQPKQNKIVGIVEQQASPSIDDSCPKISLIPGEAAEVNSSSHPKQNTTVGNVEQQVPSPIDDSCPKIVLIPYESTEVKSSSQPKQNKIVGTAEQRVSTSHDSCSKIALIPDESTKVKSSSQPKQNETVGTVEDVVSPSNDALALIPGKSAELKSSSHLKRNRAIRNVEEQVPPSLDESCPKIFDVPNGSVFIPDESTEVKSSSQPKQNKIVGLVEQQASPSIDDSCPKTALIPDEATEVKSSSQPKQNKIVGLVEQQASPSIDDSCPKTALIPDEATEVKSSSQPKQNKTVGNVEQQVPSPIDDSCPKTALIPDEATEVKSSSQPKQNKTIGTVEVQMSTSIDDSCPNIQDFSRGALYSDESTEVECSRHPLVSDELIFSYAKKYNLSGSIERYSILIKIREEVSNLNSSQFSEFLRNQELADSQYKLPERFITNIKKCRQL